MRLSVAMCTYNGAPYVREQLESVAAQRRPPDELVVCDDRSDDGTKQIIEAFAHHAPFPVRLFVNDVKLGPVKNFERAISLCVGDVIALSDQDDVWLAEKLGIMEATFAAAPAVGIAFADAEMVDADLCPLGLSLWECLRFGPAEQRLFEAGQAFNFLLDRNVVSGMSMAFRAQYKELILPIPEDEFRLTAGDLIHDGWIAALIAAVAQFAYIPERLVLYRQHPGQLMGARPQGEDAPRAGGMAGLSSELRERTREALRQISSDQDFAASRQLYLAQLQRFEPIIKRLVEKNAVFNPTLDISHWEAKLRHLQTRARLPANRLARVAPVLRELLALRYHSHSAGLSSVAKDLFQ